MTTGSPPSITDTTEFVVPRSIPITFAMRVPPAALAHCKHGARKTRYAPRPGGTTGESVSADCAGRLTGGAGALRRVVLDPGARARGLSLRHVPRQHDRLPDHGPG